VELSTENYPPTLKSLEHPRELPVRPSAEQAVKVPIQTLQGSAKLSKFFQRNHWESANWESAKKSEQDSRYRSPECLQASVQCAFPIFP
jgi:hypothetical protein